MAFNMEQALFGGEQKVEQPKEFNMEQALFGVDPLALKTNVGQALNTNPDTEADFNRIAKETGIPTEAVRADPNYARNVATMSKLDAMRLTEKAPVTSKVLAENPIAARLWHDEIDRLADIEDRIKGLTEVATGKAKPLQEWQGAEPTAGNIARGIAAVAKQPIIGLETAVTDVLAGIGVFSEEQKQSSFRKLRQEYSQTEFAQPRLEGKLARGAYGAAASLTSTLSSLGVGLATGSAGAGATTGGVMGGLQGYAEKRLMQEKGFLESASYGGLQGYIEKKTEELPLDWLLKAFGKKPVKELLGALGADIIGEQVATAGQGLVDVAYGDQTLDDYRNQFGDNAATTLISSVLMSGLIGGASAAVYGLSGRREEALRARQAADTQETLNTLLSESKARNRDTDTFESLVKEKVAETPLRDVYLQIDDLDDAEIAHLSSLSDNLATQIKEARTTGGSIIVPTEVYQTKIAGTKIGDTITDKVAFSPAGLTKREAERTLSELDDLLRTELKDTVDKVLISKEENEGSKKLYNKITQQLMSAKMPKAIAQTNAIMHTAYYNTVAKELNISIEEAYNRFGGDITYAEQINDLSDAMMQDEIIGVESATSEIFDYADRESVKGKRPLNIARDNGEVLGGAFYKDEDGVYTFSIKALDERAEVPLVSDAIKDFVAMGKEGVLRAEVTKDSVKDILARRSFKVVGEQDGITIMEATNIQDAYAKSLLLQGKALGSFNVATKGIKLHKNYSLSTFMHESAHLYLENLSVLAKESEKYNELWQETLKWFGIDEATWNGLTIEQKRRYHESFARAYETYLYEGRAPNSKLERVFHLFSSWLIKSYKSIKRLMRAVPDQIQISQDMRLVFDRLLSIDEELELVSPNPLFANAEEAGMSEADFQTYLDLLNVNREKAFSYLAKKSLADLRWLSEAKNKRIRKMQKEAEAKRNVIRNEVFAELKERPVYKAWLWLKKGDEDGGIHHIDIDMANALYKNSSENPLDRITGKFGKYGLFGKDGLDPDAVALTFGYSSGDALIKDLAFSMPLNQAVIEETDARMFEEHAELSSDEAITRAVEEAIHNDAHLRFLATETKAAEKLAGKPFSGMKVINAYAADLIGNTKVGDLKPRVFIGAERYHAREAERLQKLGIKSDIEARIARAKEKLKQADEKKSKQLNTLIAGLEKDAERAGKRELIALEKKKQLIQATAAKESLVMLRKIDKALAYTKSLKKDDRRKKMHIDAVKAIDAILENYNFAKGITKKEKDERNNIRSWFKAYNANMESLGEAPIDIDIIDDRISYKELTTDDFFAVIDTLKTLEAMGRNEKRLLTDKANREYEELVTEIEGSLNSVADEFGKDVKSMDEMRSTLRKDRNFLRKVKGYLASHRNLASIIKEFDGFKDNRILWNVVVRPMNEAADAETKARRAAMQTLTGIIRPLSEAGAFSSKQETFAGLPITLNRGEQVVFVANMGNRQNLQRLVDGLSSEENPVSMDAVIKVAENLTEQELETVNKIWAFLETYKPIIAKTEREAFGTEPTWVEPLPFSVESSDGKIVRLTGGYYPIKYDPRLGKSYNPMEEYSAVQNLAGARLTHTPSRGYAKKRSEVITDRTLDFRINGLFNGVNTIIHSTSWMHWVRDMNKLFKDRKIKEAIVSRFDYEKYDQIIQAIEDITVGDRADSEGLARLLGTLRQNTVAARLAFNFLNGFTNLTGLVNSFERVGWSWVGKGLVTTVEEIKNGTPFKLAYEKAEFMRDVRSQALVREQNELKNLLREKGKFSQAMSNWMFIVMEQTQKMVDMPTWYGEYYKQLYEGVDEKTAILLADQAVTDAQGGGQLKDLAAVQRGSEYQKIFTLFTGYFAATYRLAAEKTLAANLKKHPENIWPLMVTYLTLYILPAAISAYIIQPFLTGEDDDDRFDDFKRQALGMILSQFVGLREIQPWVFKAFGAETYGSYKGPASLSVIDTGMRMSEQFSQGDLDKALVKSVIDMVGLTTGAIPSTQINRTIDGIDAIAEGKTNNPTAVLFGYRKK